MTKTANPNNLGLLSLPGLRESLRCGVAELREPAGVFKQYVEDSNQAERSSDRHMAHRSRKSVKYAG